MNEFVFFNVKVKKARYLKFCLQLSALLDKLNGSLISQYKKAKKTTF